MTESHLSLIFSFSFNFISFSSMVLCQYHYVNEDLINDMKLMKIIKSEKVENVMKQLDRGNYVSRNAYQDAPQSIGYGATISAPHMHACVLELLQDKLVDGEKALDVGSGSGYLTACMSLMLGPNGTTVGIDHIEELVNKSIINIKKDKPELLTSGRLKLVVGDGREGYAPDAPYNAIHVGAAYPGLPEKLLEQLKPGGRLIIPIGDPLKAQSLEQIDKEESGNIVRTPLTSVVYVPLTDKSKQLRGI